MRFLSHAETLRVFQRACVRAGIKIQYSQGFNPRPKLSLPLPRSVGIESDDELLCLRIHDSSRIQSAHDLCTLVKTELSSQLPEGFELLSVGLTESNTPLQPYLATYILTLQRQYLSNELKTRADRLLANKTINMERRTGTKNSNFKNVDVRPFLQSIELGNMGVVIECKISPAGSIRVEEFLELLKLDAEKLAAPIRRTNVKFVAYDM